MSDQPFDKKRLYIVLIVALLVVIGVLAFLLLRPVDDGQLVTQKDRDPNAAVGQYEGKTQEEIQAELDRVVEQGMFNVSINPNVVMENGNSEADFRIENIEANHHLMSVEVTLDDTGQVLYTSGIIEPGYHIQTVPLAVALDKGTHEATATFTAYDEETEDVVGQTAVKVTITVNG